MGRGRAKAKQTKVARELKYRPMDMDISSLEQELRSESGAPHVPPAYEDLASEYDQDSDPGSGYGDLRKSG